MGNPLINLMGKKMIEMSGLKEFLNKGGSPKDLILQAIQGGNGKEINKLIQYAQTNNIDGLKKYASDIFAKQGRDFEKEFAEFMSNLNK